MRIKSALPALVCMFLAFAVYPQDSGAPGSFDNAAPSQMSEVLALDAKLNPGDDEFVVYYVRKDANYAPWALWIWAVPGGDGGASWPYTQNWKVQDGIAYMRLKTDGSQTGGTKIISDEGTVGLIVRQKEEWNKDGNSDRIWNANTSRKVAIFSGDQNTYAAADYRPSVKSASLLKLNEIYVKLSGRYGLDTDGGSSGFSVVSTEGKEYRISKVVNANSPSDLSKNMTKDVLIRLSENVDIGENLVLKNDAFLGDAKISGVNLAVQIAESSVPPANTVLGCSFDGNKASFALWAPTSSSAKVLVYKNGSDESAWKTFDMTKNSKTGVWSASYEGSDIDGSFYEYELKNSKGTVKVLDPYALSMACFDGKGGAGRAAVVNLSSEKAGEVTEPYVNLSQREDAVIYEVSVRDFTISPDADVNATPGTFNAFVEKIPYLKSLGITHVQFLPVVNFYFNDEANKSYENSGTVNGNNYNWGYDPHNYFTPEGWYSSDPHDPYCRIRELRNLINECHKAGIGVLLDVVYNHMATTQFLDDIVPGYYFRTDANGAFKSNSGCGNDTATERKMMKRIVLDSTTHWVKNYKVDGFRFDLMGLMEASSVTDSYNLCKKINPSVLFEGEGWKMYNGESGTVGMDQNYMTKTNSVSVFNDEFRDLIKAGGFNETGRGFITKKSTDGQRLFANLTGSPLSNYRADDPGDNLNYLVCHDGLTLHDAIVHNLRLDEGKDRKEIIDRIKLGNFTVLTSQGVAFLHAGQERGRTKPNVRNAKNESIGNFVRNSYDSSDNINQFVWTLDEDYESLRKYTEGLIEIRKSNKVFRTGDAKKIRKNFRNLEIDDPLGLVFGYTIKDGKNSWVIIINAKSETAKINVGISLDNGVILVDNETSDKDGIAEPEGVEISGETATLAPLTATVIRL